jgi:hypothetical protein
MAFGDHALEDRGVARVGVVDGALASVVAGDEEGGARIVLLEKVEEGCGVNVGAVVKRQGELSGNGARGDVDAEGDGPESWTWGVGCVGTRGALVAVACWAEGEETPGCCAEITTSSANSLEIKLVSYP